MICCVTMLQYLPILGHLKTYGCYNVHLWYTQDHDKHIKYQKREIVCKMCNKKGFCYKTCYYMVQITSFVQNRGRITSRYRFYNTSDNQITCTKSFQTLDYPINQP